MVNRKYRDNLFRFIYSHRDNRKYLLSLYNALSGSDCRDPKEIKITTIKDVIYLTRKNDLSFLIDSQMYLMEQQSTFNPNMPVRGLLYLAMSVKSVALL